jgi:2-C-methyl-D-erythritol 4-phosphate cytidylyltransferase
MRNSVIIVAGGLGKRMGSALPKQFLEIHGKALIIYTLEKFLEFDPEIEIVLVINDDYIEYWNKAKKKVGFNQKVKIASGGETRFYSVQSGLKMLEGDSLVGIHDAVRPLVSVETIQRVYDVAEMFGSAVPCIPLKESVREVIENKSKPLDRSKIQIVQTPQVFRSAILQKSYDTPCMEEFTDDASVVEKVGYEIKLVQGDEYNLKITTPEDFEIAKMLLSPQKPHLR